jgi:hypothetical protein
MERKTLDAMRSYLAEATDELLMMREMDNLEMYRTITDKGKELEGISDEERTDDNFVYGCISNVYIADDIEDGRCTIGEPRMLTWSGDSWRTWWRPSTDSHRRTLCPVPASRLRSLPRIST